MQLELLTRNPQSRQKLSGILLSRCQSCTSIETLQKVLVEVAEEEHEWKKKVTIPHPGCL